jgi:hypothetical protein
MGELKPAVDDKESKVPTIWLAVGVFRFLGKVTLGVQYKPTHESRPSLPDPLDGVTSFFLGQ